METLSEDRSFGGVQGVYCHEASQTNCEMTFAVYMPPQAHTAPVSYTHLTLPTIYSV